MNFLNALERIPKLVEQYKAQNVTYERDIPILQETVGGVWKKEDELKALKADVAALERKIQLTLAPPKPEDGQEHTDGVQQENGQRDSSMVATTNERLQISQERLSNKPMIRLLFENISILFSQKRWKTKLIISEN